jgi:DNA-binding CsgD family transcriptional regulator
LERDLPFKRVDDGGFRMRAFGGTGAGVLAEFHARKRFDLVFGGKHAPIKEIQASLKARYPRMSMRELEVAARVKAGMSARQIATELGIAETTVITHRNSAYARAGVTNLRELLLA